MAKCLAYCRTTGKEAKSDGTHGDIGHFGVGSVHSMGAAKVSFPTELLILSFTAHVVDKNVLMLLSIDDIKRLGLYLNTICNKLEHRKCSVSAKIVCIWRHPYLRWQELIQCFFTYTELRRLHRGFKDPSANMLFNLLSRAKLSDMDTDNRQMLLTIERLCALCLAYAQHLHRFRFTFQKGADFSRSIYVDMFYIRNKLFLHVVDETARFQDALWLLTPSLGL